MIVRTGGNLGLFGDFEQLNEGPMEALAQKKSIAGVGIDPEGIDNNPVSQHSADCKDWSDHAETVFFISPQKP